MNIYIGDEVEIEKSSSSKWPRWMWNEDNNKWIDTGSSGEFIKGVINKIIAEYFIVNFPGLGPRWFEINTPDHIWKLPGFYYNLSSETRRRKDNGCSCGAWSMYGKDWDQHDGSCSYYDDCERKIGMPKNNDGRRFCYFCMDGVINMGGYQICNNKDCTWYQR